MYVYVLTSAHYRVANSQFLRQFSFKSIWHAHVMSVVYVFFASSGKKVPTVVVKHFTYTVERSRRSTLKVEYRRTERRRRAQKKERGGEEERRQQHNNNITIIIMMKKKKSY